MKITLFTICIVMLDVILILLYLLLDLLLEKIQLKKNRKNALYRQKAYITPAPGADELHYTVSQYFLNNQHDCMYSLGYDILYPTDVEILKEAGWTVTMEINVIGNLIYVFHRKSVSA